MPCCIYCVSVTSFFVSYAGLSEILLKSASVEWRGRHFELRTSEVHLVHPKRPRFFLLNCRETSLKKKRFKSLIIVDYKKS